MSRTTDHHHNLTNGVGKCSRPMWSGYGMPAGFCDRPAYGKQRTPRFRGDDLPYTPGLACEHHGGPPSPYVDVVFDGPPSHESGRFVEVEDATGKSIRFGEWTKRSDGLWALRLPLPEVKEATDG